MARSKTKARPQINFSTTPAEKAIIAKIADRTMVLVRDLRGSPFAKRSKLDWEMDLTACHCNGTPLQLERLAAFDAFNLVHDVLGIARHLDRTTGKLQNCFLPRCARPERKQVPA